MPKLPKKLAALRAEKREPVSEAQMAEFMAAALRSVQSEAAVKEALASAPDLGGPDPPSDHSSSGDGALAECTSIPGQGAATSALVLERTERADEATAPNRTELNVGRRVSPPTPAPGIAADAHMWAAAPSAAGSRPCELVIGQARSISGMSLWSDGGGVAVELLKASTPYKDCRYRGQAPPPAPAPRPPFGSSTVLGCSHSVRAGGISSSASVRCPT